MRRDMRARRTRSRPGERRSPRPIPRRSSRRRSTMRTASRIRRSRFSWAGRRAGPSSPSGRSRGRRSASSGCRPRSSTIRRRRCAARRSSSAAAAAWRSTRADTTTRTTSPWTTSSTPSTSTPGGGSPGIRPSRSTRSGTTGRREPTAQRAIPSPRPSGSRSAPSPRPSRRSDSVRRRNRGSPPPCPVARIFSATRTASIFPRAPPPWRRRRRMSSASSRRRTRRSRRLTKCSGSSIRSSRLFLRPSRRSCGCGPAGCGRTWS